MASESKSYPYYSTLHALSYFIQYRLGIYDIESLLREEKDPSVLFNQIIESDDFKEFYNQGYNNNFEDIEEIAKIHQQFQSIEVMENSHLLDFDKIKEITGATDDEVEKYIKFSERDNILKVIHKTFPSVITHPVESFGIDLLPIQRHPDLVFVRNRIALVDWDNIPPIVRPEGVQEYVDENDDHQENESSEQ